MSLRFKLAVIFLFAMFAILDCAGGAGASGVVGVFPFQNTGASPPSHYGNGSQPESELLQASDGNFYGTTVYGGSGPCPNHAEGGVHGCGTVFQISAKTGAETVIYNFPYDTATETAPDGAYPTAGLIQGNDGALYGVAQDGGIGSITAYSKGSGTLFRITTSGVFTLLHQFCGNGGCPGVIEGSSPASHLVQTSDSTLYGTTSGGGEDYEGTLFSASTSGAVTTLHSFQNNGRDGTIPAGALVVGQDGSTLYGATQYGGTGANGTVFSYGAAGLTIIHSFGAFPALRSRAVGALILGPEGLLYGATVTVNLQNGTLYSLSTTGGGFAVDTPLPGTYNATGLLLGSDGMIYGTMIGVTQSTNAGGLFVYNPVTKAIRGLVKFGSNTGGSPEGALIEGKDHYLYGSNALLGGSNSFGATEGTLFRIGPALP